jgi:hypothetical protein
MSGLKESFRIVIAAGIVLAIAALLMNNSRISATTSAAVATKSTAPARSYYLTTANFDGSQVLAACAAGYHAADIFEIHEPSNLSYNTALGLTQPDSGTGPPVGAQGWARTSGGGHSCNLWTSNASSDVGTTFELDPVYSDSPTVLAPWLASGPLTCNFQFPVWCLQN